MDLIDKLVPIQDNFINSLPRFEFPRLGVYFLFYQDILIYIGKSRNILKRFEGHIYNKSFTNYSFLKCDYDYEASILERELIQKYNPI